jgi:polysaccharide deacetylase family protein (PEP-CTERM system associated)
MEETRPTEKNLDGVLTVDLEDWHNALVKRPRTDSCLAYPLTDPEHLQRIVRMLLREFADSNTKATFFVVGEVVREAPEIVAEIVKNGHEIASHSSIHVPPNAIPRDKLRYMLEEDIAIFSEISGEAPIGFRAPYFAITRKDGWLLKLLSELGFKYDSSVFPAWTPLYGLPKASRRPYFPDFCDLTRSAKNGPILEIPLSVWPSTRMLPALPMAGGFFLRALPLKVQVFMLRSLVKRGERLVLYVHPADVDNERHSTKGMSFEDSFIQNIGKGCGLRNLRSILMEFRLVRMKDAFSQEIQRTNRE